MLIVGATLVSLNDDNAQVVATAETFFLWIPISIGFVVMMQSSNSSFNARGLPQHKAARLCKIKGEAGLANSSRRSR